MQILSSIWTAVKPQVLDKASINYWLTVITEVTTIYFYKWKNFAKLKTLRHWKMENTPIHLVTQQTILQLQCSPWKIHIIKDSNILPSFHYNDSSLNMTLAYQVIRTLIIWERRSDQVQPGTHNSCSLPKWSTKQPHFWMKSIPAILQFIEVCCTEHKLQVISKFSDSEI